MLKNKLRSGFTIVELIVVIAVIGILAGIILVSYGAWRTSVATASVKSDLEHAASSMESSRSFNNSFPLTLPTTFSPSAGNTITLFLPADTKSFCIDGSSSQSASIQYYIDNLTQANGSTAGTCATRTNLPIPASVTNVHFTSGSPSIIVTWTLAANASQYLVQCAADPGFITGLLQQTASGGTTVTQTLTGANPATTYFCRVRAANANGNGAWSTTAAQMINGGNVTTLVGSVAGFVNGPIASAKLSYPQGVTIDATGTIYVADTYNNRIRKITSAGVVSTLAGSGTAGFADGPAASAQFNLPSSVAADSSGNVYVADGANQRIRKITSAGVVSTFAGNGTAGFVNGTGTAAQLAYPNGVATDSAGNVYVADFSNSVIRKITPAGVVSTYAGTGTSGSADGAAASAQFSYPEGVAVDASGNVYVADYSNNKVRKITMSGVVSTLAGSGTAGSVDGPGASAQFNNVAGVAVDASGNVYVADYFNHQIRKVTSAGIVSTLAGSGAAGYAEGQGTSAVFNYPTGVTVDAGGIVYVADYFNSRIRMIQ